MAGCIGVPSGDVPKSLPYDRVLLPVIKLKGSTNSKQLEQRFNYLWNAAHTMVTTSPPIAHCMISSITELARRHHIELPMSVMDYICQRCNGLILPSVTADVHVHSVSHQSAINRKLARNQRKLRRNDTGLGTSRVKREFLQNVLHIKCHRCEFSNVRHGASKIHKIKRKKSKKRLLDSGDATANDTQMDKKQRVELTSEMTNGQTVTTESNDSEKASVVLPPPRSVFAPPPSSPRKLLDGPKKKKKKTSKPDVATTAVKSSLNSLLQTLRPSFDR